MHFVESIVRNRLLEISPQVHDCILNFQNTTFKWRRNLTLDHTRLRRRGIEFPWKFPNARILWHFLHWNSPVRVDWRVQRQRCFTWSRQHTKMNELQSVRHANIRLRFESTRARERIYAFCIEFVRVRLPHTAFVKQILSGIQLIRVARRVSPLVIRPSCLFWPLLLVVSPWSRSPATTVASFLSYFSVTSYGDSQVRSLLAGRPVQ